MMMLEIEDYLFGHAAQPRRGGGGGGATYITPPPPHRRAAAAAADFHRHTYITYEDPYLLKPPYAFTLL